MNDLQPIRIEYLANLLPCFIGVGGIHDSMLLEWHAFKQRGDHCMTSHVQRSPYITEISSQYDKNAFFR